MTDSTPKGLLPKLLAAQRMASNVAKQGENVQQHYKYARAEDVIREAQKALHGADLVGTMIFADVSEREITSQKGGAGLYVTLSGSLRIADPESGEVLEVPGFGTGIDYPGDKAIYKAMTGAAKYAYASALGIAFGDDPEHDPDGSAAQPRERGTANGSGISTKQRNFLEGLLRDAGAGEQDRLLILAWASETLTGGRGGTASKAIEGLKSEPKPTLDRLLEAARAWDAERIHAELPGDTADLTLEDA